MEYFSYLLLQTLREGFKKVIFITLVEEGWSAGVFYHFFLPQASWSSHGFVVTWSQVYFNDTQIPATLNKEDLDGTYLLAPGGDN